MGPRHEAAVAHGRRAVGVSVCLVVRGGRQAGKALVNFSEKVARPKVRCSSKHFRCALPTDTVK